MGGVSSVTVTSGRVAVGSTAEVGDAEGTATSVSVREEAKVATASVRTTLTSPEFVWLSEFIPHENSRNIKIPIKSMDAILVFIG